MGAEGLIQKPVMGKGSVLENKWIDLTMWRV